MSFACARFARMAWLPAACGVLALSFTAPATAQVSKSSVAAKELGEVLDRLKLDSIAAADPADPGT
jgi:hypothetical protein